MHKYRAKKAVVDGIKFDSKAEAARYRELKLLEKAGLITNLELQPKFELQPGFEKDGAKYRAITYTADFKYFDVETGQVVVEDVKGYRTQQFELRKKMFEYKYKDLRLRLI